MKTWLKENKIIIDFIATIISTLAIGITSTIVAINSNIVASNQTEIMEAENMPVLVLSNESIQDPQDGMYKNIVATLSNDGGPLYELSAENAVFLNISYIDKKDKYSLREIQIPLDGYFTQTDSTYASKGNLVTFKGFNNHAKVVELQKSLLYYSNSSYETVSIEVDSSFHFMYKDFMHRNQESYYTLSGLGYKELENEDGQAIFKRSKDYQLADHKELTKLNIEEIKKIIENNQNR